MALGDYTKAEPLYREALRIARTALGEDDPDFAASVKDLASLYQAMGSYKRAERLFRQAVEIYRKSAGDQDLGFARSLNDLAGLLERIGKYTDAEPLYQQALKIQCAALGTHHPEVATTFNNLAYFRNRWKYEEAEPLYRKALRIRRAVFGQNHPDVATSYNNLAELHRTTGDDAAARPLLKRALAIRRATLGDHHPAVAQSLNNLAALYVKTGRVTSALKLFQQAEQIDQGLIGQMFAIGSESQRMAYLASLQGRFYAFLSLVQRIPNQAAAARAGLDLVLRRKAIGAEALAVQRDQILGGRYPEFSGKLRHLAALRMQIAQHVLAGPGDEGMAAFQRQLGDLNAQKEHLEADLAHLIPEMRLEQHLFDADRYAVASMLPAAAALVEFIRFNVFDFAAVPARGESKWNAPRYLAFVVLAGSRIASR